MGWDEYRRIVFERQKEMGIPADTELTPHDPDVREVFRGGCTDPFILHWPAGVEAPGGLRSQYAHIIDMVPTVLDLLGIEPPETIAGVKQAPIEGVSFAHTINDAAAPTRHTTQYFEMLGTRAIYHDGWRAVCGWPGPSLTEAAAKGRHLFDQITTRRPWKSSTPKSGSCTAVLLARV